MPATRLSVTSKRHPPQHSRSYPLRPQPDDHFKTTASDVTDMVKYPDVEEVGRARAETLHKSREGRRGEASKRMAPHSPRRTQWDSKAYTTKDTKMTVHEVRRTQDSEHRRRSHRPEREEDRDGGGTFYVYKTRKSSREEMDRDRRSDLRRSQTTGEASRSRQERSHKEDRELARRQSERRTPHREERVYTPLRREKRSIAEIVPKRVRENPPVRRSASVRETRSLSIFRPILLRSQTSTRKPRPPSYPLSPLPHAREKLERNTSTVKINRGTDRSSGIFSFMATPKPSRRVEPEKLVECLACGDEAPISKCPKLSCSHRMCHSCLHRLFTHSVSDPQLMPPKCCTADCIPLEHVSKLFDNKFKQKWNRKYQEFTTKDRIYCPARRCGQWIKPSHIHVDTSGGANHGRKYGKCQKCQTKVCCLCNNKWHSSRECPKDLATQEFIKIAKQEGWQRCFNCQATVELKEGCNHMTCRCGAQFCMVCGLEWKTCDCPWFTHEAVEADRLQHINVPVDRQEDINRRREQERRDEELARRLQIDVDEESAYGNAAPHFMNENFVRRAADPLSAVYNPTQEARQQRREAQVRPQRPEPTFDRPQPQLQRPRQLPLRQHSTASRQYNNRDTTRASERIVPRRSTTVDYAAEVATHQPATARASTLAGITRGQTGDGRVDEWRRHIDPWM